MKKAIFLFVFSLVNLSTFANDTFVNDKEPQNLISIKIDPTDAPETVLEFAFETAEELYNFDVESKVSDILKDSFDGEFCTASITVTVRVGVDSTFAEASVTVEGISCDKIASEIKRLKAELKAALQ